MTISRQKNRRHLFLVEADNFALRERASPWALNGGVLVWPRGASEALSVCLFARCRYVLLSLPSASSWSFLLFVFLLVHVPLALVLRLLARISIVLFSL